MNTDCLGTSNCACGIICDLAAEFFGYAANHTAINRNVPHIPFRYMMEHSPKWGNVSNQELRPEAVALAGVLLALLMEGRC